MQIASIGHSMSMHGNGMVSEAVAVYRRKALSRDWLVTSCMSRGRRYHNNVRLQELFAFGVVLCTHHGRS